MIAVLMLAVLCFWGFLCPKSKWTSYAILIYMWIFYGFNYYSGDYISYEYVYHSIGEGQLLSHFEPAFSLLMFLCNQAGFGFFGFRIVLATIFVILLKLVIDQYTSCSAFVLSLFALFPFLYFTSVLRAGISGLIIAYSMKYLAGNKQKDTVHYVVGIAAASLMHVSSVFYLIFLLAKKKMSPVKIIGMTLVLSALAVGYHMGLFYRLLSLVTDNEKVLQWFDNFSSESTLNWKGKLAAAAVLGMFLFMMHWSKRITIRNAGASTEQVKMQEVVYTCNLCFLLLLPFLMISDVWMRMIWEVYLVNLCMLVNTSELNVCDKESRRTIRNRTKLPFICIALLCMEILFFVYSEMPYRGTENAVIHMFYNNLVFQYFPM